MERIFGAGWRNIYRNGGRQAARRIRDCFTSRTDWPVHNQTTPEIFAEYISLQQRMRFSPSPSSRTTGLVSSAHLLTTLVPAQHQHYLQCTVATCMHRRPAAEDLQYCPSVGRSAEAHSEVSNNSSKSLPCLPAEYRNTTGRWRERSIVQEVGTWRAG